MAQFYQYEVLTRAQNKYARAISDDDASELFTRPEAIIFILDRNHLRLRQLGKVASYSAAGLRIHLYENESQPLPHEITSGLAAITNQPAEFWQKSHFSLKDIESVEVNFNSLGSRPSHRENYLLGLANSTSHRR